MSFDRRVEQQNKKFVPGQQPGERKEVMGVLRRILWGAVRFIGIPLLVLFAAVGALGGWGIFFGILGLGGYLGYRFRFGRVREVNRTTTGTDAAGNRVRDTETIRIPRFPAGRRVCVGMMAAGFGLAAIILMWRAHSFGSAVSKPASFAAKLPRPSRSLPQAPTAAPAQPIEIPLRGNTPTEEIDLTQVTPVGYSAEFDVSPSTLRGQTYIIPDGGTPVPLAGGTLNQFPSRVRFQGPREGKGVVRFVGP